MEVKNIVTMYLKMNFVMKALFEFSSKHNSVTNQSLANFSQCIEMYVCWWKIADLRYAVL